ncbi:MAG TPA: helix-turn-helix domain-containing protein [Candidatus Tectomicrobia bacterium]
MDERVTPGSSATGPYDDEPLRQQVLRILAHHPAGLTPGEIASQLALTTSLTSLLRTMAQAGLVQRVTAEIYRRPSL